MQDQANNAHVRFAHYRNLDTDYKPESRGGATVAYVTNEDGTISYAVAYCHERDNYNKNMGRVKASGRLKSKSYRVDTEFSDSKKFVEEMDDEMVEVRNLVRQYRHNNAEAA